MTFEELIKKYEISCDEIDIDNAIYDLSNEDIEDIDADEIRESIQCWVNKNCDIIGCKNAYDFLLENDHKLTILKDYLSEFYGDSVPLSEIDIERFATIVNYEKQMDEVYDIVQRINEAIDEELGSIYDDV